jgi:hypothetical protein
MIALGLLLACAGMLALSRRWRLTGAVLLLVSLAACTRGSTLSFALVAWCGSLSVAALLAVLWRAYGPAVPPAEP